MPRVLIQVCIANGVVDGVAVRADRPGARPNEIALTGIAGRTVDRLVWQVDGIPDLQLVEAYEARGRPHDHLPPSSPVRTRRSTSGRNPGRRTAFDGMWLWAAARMWFGGGAFEHLDRERLLELPVGEVAELGNRAVRVDLFPLEWYRGSAPALRERRAAFCEWMATADRVQDATGLRAVPRSRARQRWTVELAADGSVVAAERAECG